MDRVVFFGFPSESWEKTVEPFVRSGVVAYSTTNPNLKVDGRPLLDDSVFLVDAPAFPGNSGGPVIQELYFGGVNLWGLMTGSAPERSYSIVTPVTRIVETLIHTRSASTLNANAWRSQPPNLRFKCVYQEGESK